MTVRNNNINPPTLWADELQISSREIIDILSLNNNLGMIIREAFINNTLEYIKLDKSIEIELLDNFKKAKAINSQKDFETYLQTIHVSEKTFIECLTRPERLIRFREERWGPRANSLYLKNKDQYDKITYQRLSSQNQDAMQEVYFRLKDKEDTWENMARQFPGGTPESTAVIGPISVANVEKELVDKLREGGQNKVLKPIQIGESFIVSELILFEASKFDDNLRKAILNSELEAWLNEECIRLLKKVKVI